MSEEDMDILKIEVVLDERIYERDIGEDLKFSRMTLDSISKAAEEQSRLYANYGVMMANAKADMQWKEKQVDIIEADLAKEIREKLVEEHGKRGVTETQIKQEIKQTDKYKNAIQDYIDSVRVYETIKHAVRAFDHRKDMIITVGANARDELSGGINIKQKMSNFEGEAKDVSRKVKEIIESREGQKDE